MTGRNPYWRAGGCLCMSLDLEYFSLAKNVSLAKCTGSNVCQKLDGSVAAVSTNGFFFFYPYSYIYVPSNSVTSQCPEWFTFCTVYTQVALKITYEG